MLQKKTETIFLHFSLYTATLFVKLHQEEHKKSYVCNKLENRAVTFRQQQGWGGKDPPPPELRLQYWTPGSSHTPQLGRAYSQCSIFQHQEPIRSHLHPTSFGTRSKVTFAWSETFHFRSEFSIICVCVCVC